MVNGYLTADEIIEKTVHLMNSKTGLISATNEVLLESGNPEIIVYSSMLSKLENSRSHIKLRINDGLAMAGSGSSTSRKYAKAKAICEALERYCNISYNPADVKVATRNELGESAVDLSRFPKGTKEEYALPTQSYSQADNDKRIRWVKGHSLTSGESLWVPFSCVYISTPFEFPGETFFIPISTGSAIAGNFERAVVSGALEVIERDALSLTWLQEFPLKRIDYSSCKNPEFWQRLQSIEKSGIKQSFFDATMEHGFPTVYAVQEAPNSDLNLLVMAATRYNIEDAMIRVMDEAISSRTAIEHLVRQPKLYDPTDFSSFTRLTDGAVYYGDKSNSHAFDFLMKKPVDIALEDTTSITVENEVDMLNEIIARFKKNDMDLIVVDISVPQLKEVGLRAVRVVVPELMPLTTDHSMKFSATQRIYDVAKKLGYDSKAFGELNNNPQPFA